MGVSSRDTKSAPVEESSTNRRMVLADLASARRACFAASRLALLRHPGAESRAWKAGKGVETQAAARLGNDAAEIARWVAREVGRARQRAMHGTGTAPSLGRRQVGEELREENDPFVTYTHFLLAHGNGESDVPPSQSSTLR